MEHERINLLKGYNFLLYFAGSMIMEKPTDECLIDFWTRGTLKNLPVASSNPRYIRATAFLRSSCTDQNLCREMLAEDYSRLFEENLSPLAAPLASLYDRSNGMNIAIGVSEVYKAYSWEPRHHKKSADHLGVEILFLTRLIDGYISLEDVPCRSELRKEICHFIGDFMLPWIPAWNEDIQKNAFTSSYKGIGTLIYACMEDIHQIFGCNGKMSV